VISSRSVHDVAVDRATAMCSLIGMPLPSKRRISRVLAALALTIGYPVHAEPRLTVTPTEGVFDEPFDVRLEGAPPNERVSIRVIRTDADQTDWTTTGIYRSDEAGLVDVSTMPSLGVSYRGVSPHGLLCSALPEGTEGFDAYIDKLKANPRLPRSFPARLEAIAIRIEASIDDEVVAVTTASRGHAIDVSGEEIATAEGVRGLYFASPEGVSPRAPVMILNGSGGGVRSSDAARLASHGHPALAFAIYNYGDLPKTLQSYPIEKIADGARWLASRTGQDGVAVIGVSRGSEAAAQAAIAFPELFSGVVLSVPSHLADAGALAPDARKGDGAWTIGGRAFPVTDLGFWTDDPRIAEQAKTLPGYNATGMVLGKWGSKEFEDKYGIAFERIEAPVLVVAAAEDHIWPSWVSAERIRQRFERAGKGGRVEVRVYPGAGHSIVAPAFGGPLSMFAYNPGIPGFMDFGGTPNGNCDAAFESSRAILAFLDGVGGQP
jgi:pimeloyl-ACP methyl ester carboxylesterase